MASEFAQHLFGLGPGLQVGPAFQKPGLFAGTAGDEVFGVAGLRLGYLLSADREFIDAVRAALPIWNINGLAEEFMRTVISKTIADYVEMKSMNAAAATEAGIAYLVRKVKGRGGVIVIDKDGNCASGFTTKKMIHGWIEHGGEAVVRF